MTDDLRQKAIALYDHFTHIGMDRRAFMTDLTKLAGSAAAANALLAGIAGNAAAAAVIAEDDKRLKPEYITWPVAGGRTMRGYWATLAGGYTKRPTVIVIHENRGLTPHIRDVTRRLALEGFHALAPDFLAVAGGTPVDEDKAREMIGALVLADAIADGAATVAWLQKEDRVKNGKVGVVGFCWGGAMSNNIAVAAGDTLAAAVPYYGPAPDPAQAIKVKAPILLQYAETDERVNKTAQPWIDALKAAKVPVEAYFYLGTQHAFNNDTSAERYNKAAADLAWGRTIAHFRKYLK